MVKKSKKSSKKIAKEMVTMEKNVCETTSCHATCITRVTLGFVFVYFSIMKLFFGAAPPVDKIITFMPADVSLFLMGLLEFMIGTLLILGLFTRVAGWAAAGLFAVFFASAVYLQISGILPGLWSAAGMAKDVALLGAAVAVGIQGAPCCSIDAWIKKKCSK
ncbi:MAG: DoxX family protein [Nanoarchaeota archaeon]